MDTDGNGGAGGSGDGDSGRSGGATGALTADTPGSPSTVSDAKADKVIGLLEDVLDEQGLSSFSKQMAKQWLKRVFAPAGSEDAAVDRSQFDRARAWLLAQVNHRLSGRVPAPPSRWQVGCPEIVPELRAHAFWPLDEFEWVPRVTAAFDSIKAEVLSLRGTGTFQPYRAPKWNKDRAAAAVPDVDGGSIGTVGTDRGDWNVFYLYLHNADFAENRERCPVTTALLESIPGNYHHAFFSAMAPDTHITPHNGPTNKKLRVHLPLIVPSPAGACRLRVGDETRAWREGEVLIFDDSLQHEATADATAECPRVVLIFDIWHPDLSAPEIKFLHFLQQARMRVAKAASQRGGLDDEDDFYTVLERARATDPDDSHIFPVSSSPSS